MARKMIRRFPRIPSAQGMGAATRKMWKRPTFCVREHKDCTEFRFTLPFLIPEKTRRTKVAHFTFLFDFQSIDIAHELEEAYYTAKYKGIQVSQLIDRSIRSVLQEAMSTIYLKAKTSGHPNARFLQGGRDEFAAAARPRRISESEPRNRRAIRLAENYRILYPKVNELKIFVKSYKNRTDEAKLIRAVENRFREPWITHVTRGNALRELPDVPGHEHRHLDHANAGSIDGTPVSLGGLDWTVRQLTAAIISCQEAGERPRIHASTILEDYISLGNRLRRSRTTKLR